MPTMDFAVAVNLGPDNGAFAQLISTRSGKIFVRGYAGWQPEDSRWTDWAQIATAIPPQEYDLPMEEGWSGSIRYSKTQEGLVLLYVAVSKETAIGTGSFPVGLLPAGYRPRTNVSCAAINTAEATRTTASRIAINTAGGIVLQQSDGTATGIFASLCFVSAD